MGHHCHADGCKGEGHDEVPFCKAHFQKLPKDVRERLWKGRWPAKQCGLCNPGKGLQRSIQEGLWPSYREWFDLVNQSIAFLLVVDFGPHDCPDTLRDAGRFCWGCGIHDVPKVFAVVAGWPLEG
jgi:hypothetical protein